MRIGSGFFRERWIDLSPNRAWRDSAPLMRSLHRPKPRSAARQTLPRSRKAEKLAESAAEAERAAHELTRRAEDARKQAETLEMEAESARRKAERARKKADEALNAS